MFGGFTPAICTFLIEASGNRAAPALWLCFAASLSLCCGVAVAGLLASARAAAARAGGMTHARQQKTARSGTVIRAASGNFLELYDYLVYVYFAGYIAKAFFPARSEFVSLMLALGTYGVASFARPFGAVILGSYMDRAGRAKGCC